MNSLYVVATWVPRRTTLTIGALGAVTFERGWHAYVGSARSGRDARIARHFRADKPLRWHADHLFVAFPPTRGWLLDGDLTECELAGALTRLPGAARLPVRFGAGDCHCAGHLVCLSRLPTVRGLRELPASLPASAESRAGGAVYTRVRGIRAPQT